MENECEALPGVAYPGVRDNRSTLNTKTGYDDDDEVVVFSVDMNGHVGRINTWYARYTVYLATNTDRSQVLEYAVWLVGVGLFFDCFWYMLSAHLDCPREEL